MLGKQVVNAIFSEEYDRMYEAETPVAGEQEAMELFDELNRGKADHVTKLFHSALNAMFKIRQDVCSSDR